MPCFDTTSAEYEDRLRERLNITTRLACEYLTELERVGWPIPDYAYAWWREHKQEDEERKRYEKQQAERQEILSNLRKKLTPEELDAIRLNE